MEYEVCETLWFWLLTLCFWALSMYSLGSWSNQIALIASMEILMVGKSKMTCAWTEPSFQFCFHIGRCSSWPSGHGSQGRRRIVSSLIRSKFGPISLCSILLDAKSSQASATAGWDRKQLMSIYNCHWWPHQHSTSEQYRIQNGLWDSSPTLFLRRWGSANYPTVLPSSNWHLFHLDALYSSIEWFTSLQIPAASSWSLSSSSNAWLPAELFLPSLARLKTMAPFEFLVQQHLIQQLYFCL